MYQLSNTCKAFCGHTFPQIHSPNVTGRFHRKQATTVARAVEKPRNFASFLTPEQEAALEAGFEASRQQGMKEYKELKDAYLRRTWKFGAFFAGYLLLGVSGEAAFAELIGAAFSCAYVYLLMRDVDAFDMDSKIPYRDALQQPEGVSRGIAKIVSGYQQALFSSPRLLVPCVLVAGMAAINSSALHNGQPAPISPVDEACAAAGFISFKMAHVVQIYKELGPKALTEAELAREPPPKYEDLPDVEFDFRTFGLKDLYEDGDSAGHIKK